MAKYKVAFFEGFGKQSLYYDFVTVTDQDGRFRTDVPASSIGYRVRTDVSPYISCPAYYDITGPCDSIRFTCIAPGK